MRRFASIAIALFVLIASARAGDIPNMKEGLWKISTTTSSPGEKPDVSAYFLCRDHAYDQSVQPILDQATKSCTNKSDTTSGGKRYISMSCSVAGSIIASKSVITSTADTYYHTETATTYTPALYGQTQSTMVQEQTWVSACPAGMSPGDRKLADGTIQRRR